MNLNQYFDFSPVQLKGLAIWAGLLVLTAIFLLIKTYAVPQETSPPLPVFLGNEERKLTGTFILDPNTSPADSLELLPGVGRVLADKIVAYREKKPFRREIDITDVPGIGPKLYETIRPYLKVRP